MNPQIAKWDRRYAKDGSLPLAPPAEPLSSAIACVTPGRALDLGCGPGRHAVWLATHGWLVDAVDGSPTAIEQVIHNTEQAQCDGRINPTVVDLEATPSKFTIVEGRYDLIVDCYFLHRPLFETIRRGVRRGGLFVAILHLRSPNSTNRQRYVIEPGELEEMANDWGWEILHSREHNRQEGEAVGFSHDLGIAEVVARRP